MKKNIFLIALVVALAAQSNFFIQSKNKNQIIGALTIKEAYNKIRENKNNPDLIILDVRTQDEYSQGHVENAKNIDYYSKTFETDLNKLDKSKTYLVYCRSGSRSSKALKIMEKLGFNEVYNIGGIMDWQGAGYPVVK